jgi:large subunit ribosomal protein L6
MSRIGKQPVTIPADVTVTVNGSEVIVKGKLGELKQSFREGISVAVKDGVVEVTRADDSRVLRSCHGLTRALINNMVIGVSQGYRKELEINGTGFKAAVKGDVLVLTLGFASPKEYNIPAGLKITVDKDVNVKVEGIDKALVGEAAARIRSYYPAEPYKGKGIKYVGEQIRRKVGKKVA